MYLYLIEYEHPASKLKKVDSKRWIYINFNHVVSFQMNNERTATLIKFNNDSVILVEEKPSLILERLVKLGKGESFSQ